MQQVFLFLHHVEAHQHMLDGFRADAGREGVLAIFVLEGQQLVFGQQLILLQRGQARLQNHIAFEIEDALQLLQLNVEQQADAAGQRLQEPDVGDGRGQFDMAHPLAPHLGDGDFNAAFFADDALVLHPLVLAAEALVILHGAEDAGAEQPVALGLEGAVVDGLGLFDLAEGPAADPFRAGQTDLDLVKTLGLGNLVGEFGQVVHLSGPALWNFGGLGGRSG